MAGKKEDIKLTKLAECAGCGAKVGAGQLAQLLSGLEVRKDPNLLVGFDKSDDAAVYKVSDDLAIVSTIDFFPPIADDPYTFGAIAATNALSDIYAMGGEPKLALNVMAVPEDMPKEVVHEILRGGAFIALVSRGDRSIAVLCRRDGGVICSLRCPRCSGIRLFCARCERQHDGGAEQKSR